MTIDPHSVATNFSDIGENCRPQAVSVEGDAMSQLSLATQMSHSRAMKEFPTGIAFSQLEEFQTCEAEVLWSNTILDGLRF
jgi:hypothetical protein